MSEVLAVCEKCETLNRLDATRALHLTPTCGKCGAEFQLHGLASDVTADGLRKILANTDKPVIVDFWASWCGPCKAYSPTFERTSRSHPEAIFLKLNTEQHPDISQELGIRGIPTTIVFKNGKEYRRQPGLLSEEMIPRLYSY